MNQEVPPRPSITAITASLLQRHWRLAALLYIALALPDVIAEAGSILDPWALLAIRFVKRLIEIAFLTSLSLVALGEFRTAPFSKNEKRRIWGLMLAAGLLTWALQMSLYALLRAGAGVGILLSIPVLLAGYYYFFYFFPIVCGRGLTLSWATRMVRENRWLPVTVSVAPLGFFMIATALCQLPYPDGRVAALNIAGAALGGIYWLLCSFYSLAAGLASLDDTQWRDAEFDPYRAPRLATIEKQASTRLIRVLRPTMGWQAIVVGVLLMLANLLRLATLPPAGHFAFRMAKVEGDLVRITLLASDPTFNFRGFQPFQFNLAGEKQKLVAWPPESALIPGRSDDVRFLFPMTSSETEVEVSFKPQRPIAETVSLEDLHLWYRGHCMFHLSLKDGTSSECKLPPKEER